VTKEHRLNHSAIIAKNVYIHFKKVFHIFSDKLLKIGE